MEVLPALTELGCDEIRDEVIRDFYDNRILIINDEISDWLLESVILNIIKWNNEDKDIPIEKRHPIKIYIDSEGGSCITMNNLVDVIRASETKIIGIAFSIVASAAFSVYIACHERIAWGHSSFLMHESSRSLSNSASRMRNWMDFMDDLDEIDRQLVLERTSITEEEYESRRKDEFLFFTPEAVKLNIVDKVIGENGCTIYDIL